MNAFEKLSAAKQKAILLLTEQIVDPDTPRLTQEEIAERCGVDRTTLWLWRTKDKEFIEAKRELVDKYADEILVDAFAALRHQLRKNKNVRAAEVLLKSQGKLNDSTKVTVEIGGNNDEQSRNQLRELLQNKGESSEDNGNDDKTI